ncbi:hypothetical protein GCM10009775_14600 [Microbacterium aoyamense]|uniref:Uncharacterized protein n=2 Tax=Microbacterium aoyamense TaxID=344166 RepID=A0ABN2PK82_9MICO
MKESTMREALEELIAAMTSSRSRARRARTEGMPRNLRPHRTRSTFVPSPDVTLTSHLAI